jgi:hypothetical protein
MLNKQQRIAHKRWSGPAFNKIYIVRFQVLTAASMKFRLFWDVAPCSHVKLTDVSAVLTADITRAMALFMEAVRASETSVNFNVTTQRYIPEDSKLQDLYYR